MKLTKRNQKDITYYPYLGKSEVMDGSYHTGEYTESYGSGVTIKANVSPNTARTSIEGFGILDDYEYTILVNGNCPIKEDTKVMIGLDTYSVTKVSKSLNFSSYGVKRIE